MAATPREIMNEWPVYRVASQETENSEVIIRTVRCETFDKAVEFVKRITGADDFTKLNFFEMHELVKDGSTKVVIGNIDTPFPTGVSQRKVEGIISPKPNTEEIADRAARRIEGMIEEFRKEKKEAKSPHPVDEELGRPVHTYKRGGYA